MEKDEKDFRLECDYAEDTLGVKYVWGESRKDFLTRVQAARDALKQPGHYNLTYELRQALDLKMQEPNERVTTLCLRVHPNTIATLQRLALAGPYDLAYMLTLLVSRASEAYNIKVQNARP